ncbi:Potassium channel, variant 2 [Basidiobolus ranarum]
MLCRLLERWLLHSTRVACFCMFIDGILHLVATVTISVVSKFQAIKHSSDFVATIIEGCLALVVAGLFAFDMKRTEDYGKCGSGLSHRARILIIVIMVAACWAGLGSIVYSLIEGWPYTSALFFCLETLATIGFGSHVPQSLGGRIFIFFYATLGIMVMGFMFAGIKVSVSEMIHYKSLMKFAKSLEKGRDELILTPSLNMNTAVTVLSLKRYRTWDDLGKKLIEEKENEMKKQLFFASCSAILFWVLGAAIFCITEHWSYIKALYFCFVAFTTIGYGDVIPMSPVGAPIFIVYVFLGVGTMTYLVSIVIENWSQHIGRVELRAAKKRKKFRRGMPIVRIAAEPADETHEDPESSMESAVKELVRVAKLFDEHMKLGLEPLLTQENTRLEPILELPRTRTIGWDLPPQDHSEVSTPRLNISPKLDIFLMDSYEQTLTGLIELSNVVDTLPATNVVPVTGDDYDSDKTMLYSQKEPKKSASSSDSNSLHVNFA